MVEGSTDAHFLARLQRRNSIITIEVNSLRVASSVLRVLAAQGWRLMQLSRVSS